MPGLHGNSKEFASGWLRQRMACKGTARGLLHPDGHRDRNDGGVVGTASSLLQVGCANEWLAMEQQADCFASLAMTGVAGKERGGSNVGRLCLPTFEPPLLVLPPVIATPEGHASGDRRLVWLECCRLQVKGLRDSCFGKVNVKWQNGKR